MSAEFWNTLLVIFGGLVVFSTFMKDLAQSREQTKQLEEQQKKSDNDKLALQMRLEKAETSIKTYVLELDQERGEKEKAKDELLQMYRKLESKSGSLKYGNKERSEKYYRNISKDEISLDLGGGISLFTPAELKHGVTVNLDGENGLDPINLIVRDGQLLISCSIYNLDGGITGVITNNKWENNPGQVFRRAYDDSGLEIMDGKGMKFQIDFINQNTIKIRGLLRLTKKVMVHGDSYSRAWHIGDLNEAELLKLSYEVTDLFEYPCEQYPCKRRKVD